MKPRIYKTNGRWRCFTPAIFGSRIVGEGWTPMEAFRAWEVRRG